MVPVPDSVEDGVGIGVNKQWWALVQFSLVFINPLNGLVFGTLQSFIFYLQRIWGHEKETSMFFNSVLLVLSVRAA